VIRCTFTPIAAADLEGIWDFIAEDSVTAADRVIKDLHSAVEALADMPNMGHLRDDLADETLRVWPVHSYLIVYRPAQRPIEIVRVVSGFRDLFAIFAGG
jgi:plasmid stabilization system protein ParE